MTPARPGPDRGPSGNRHPTIAPDGGVRCRAGWLTIAVGSEGLWRRFAPLVGIDPEEDGLATNRERQARVDALEARITEALAADDVETWMARLEEAGVPAGRIRTLDQVYGWDQVAHLGLVDEVTHPLLGTLRIPGPPVAWDRSGRPTVTPPPLLGEHQDLLED